MPEQTTQTAESIPMSSRTADIAALGKNTVAAAERSGKAVDNRAAKPAMLLATDDSDRFRSRWSEIQTGFVDEPRNAVEQADSLVADLMKRLAEGFAEERATLEKHWHEGSDVSTEDLRVALQRYRSFFDRLLSV